MLNRILLVALLTIASAVIATAQTAQKDDKYWALSEKYCNARFGFCVRYPASLMKDRAPENDDGRRFDNGNSLVMTVSGINNVSNDTLKSEMRSAKEEFDQITYLAQGKNWFVLSGQKNDVVIYLKTFVGRGSINHLQIETSVHLNKGPRSGRQIVKSVARSAGFIIMNHHFLGLTPQAFTHPCAPRTGCPLLTAHCSPLTRYVIL